jgi:integrase
VTRIRRLTQRQCEAATPIEVELPAPPREVRIGGEVIPMTVDYRGKLETRQGKQVVVKRRTRYLHDGHGLYLAVTPGKTPSTVNKSWLFRYTAGGVVLSKNNRARPNQKKIGLGSFETVSLERARELAARARRQIEDGEDPASARKARKAEMKIAERKLHTLKDARDEYVRLLGDAWSPGHKKQWSRSFEHLSDLLDLPVSSLDRPMIVKGLEKLWAEHPNTANRVRGRLEQTLSAAEVWGWRSGPNPASWDLLKHSFPSPSKVTTVKHHTALPWKDAPELMKKLRAVEGSKARALELIMLTATRTGEVLGATGEEFDLKAGLWTIPARRLKTRKHNGEEHQIPLSTAAVALLRRFELVPGKRLFELADRALWNELRRIDPAAGTVHGTARSGFSDWATDNNYPREVTEAALNHQYGSSTERAYRRTKLLTQRRKQIQDWSEFLTGREVTR